MKSVPEQQSTSHKNLVMTIIQIGLRQLFNYQLYTFLTFVLFSTFFCLFFSAMQLTHNSLNLEFLRDLRFLSFIEPRFASGTISLDANDVLGIYLKIAFIFYVSITIIKFMLNHVFKVQIHIRDSMIYGIALIVIIHLIPIVLTIVIGEGVSDKIGFIYGFLFFMLISIFCYGVYYVLNRLFDKIPWING